MKITCLKQSDIDVNDVLNSIHLKPYYAAKCTRHQSLMKFMSYLSWWRRLHNGCFTWVFQCIEIGQVETDLLYVLHAVLAKVASDAMKEKESAE